MPKRLKYAGEIAAPISPAKIPRSPEKAERDAFYGAKPWRDLRSAYLLANPLCVNCSAHGRVVAADTVHHVKERLDYPELAYAWSNLESSCKPCHTERHKLKKEAKPDEAFRARPEP